MKKFCDEPGGRGDNDKCPLYAYSMDLLNDEEAALWGKPIWYQGWDANCENWIVKAVRQLMQTYYK